MPPELASAGKKRFPCVFGGDGGMTANAETFEAWDPLESTAGADPGILIGAQRHEIGNILRSYTGYYDLVSELFQNAPDAVEQRQGDGGAQSLQGRVWVRIDL